MDRSNSSHTAPSPQRTTEGSSCSDTSAKKTRLALRCQPRDKIILAVWLLCLTQCAVQYDLINGFAAHQCHRARDELPLMLLARPVFLPCGLAAISPMFQSRRRRGRKQRHCALGWSAVTQPQEKEETY